MTIILANMDGCSIFISKVNFVLLISSYDFGLVRMVWYYYQYVITIIHILFSLCCFGLFNCVPSVPRVTHDIVLERAYSHV